MSNKWSVFSPSVSSQNGKFWNPSSPYPRGLSGEEDTPNSESGAWTWFCSTTDLLRDPDFFKGFI